MNNYHSCFCLEEDNSLRLVSSQFPIQALSPEGSFYISLSYDRLKRCQPDYGYFNGVENPSIRFTHSLFLVSTHALSYKELVTIRDCESYCPSTINDSSYFNHVMISPDSKHIIFLVRTNTKKSRLDHLFLYSLDSSQLTLLAGPSTISHYTWTPDSLSIIGFFSSNLSEKASFNMISVLDKKIKPILGLRKFKDGHPTMVDDKSFVFDTYPDRSSHQSLYLHNLETNCTIKLASIYHSPRYFGSNRCDLHPRYDKSSGLVFIDTVHTGERKLLAFSL